jgi:hypothetical protein
VALFKAFDLKAEVNGETVLGFVNGLGAFKRQALTILKECAIDNPTPGKWYSQQAWLDSFKLISEKFGASTLRQIGENVAKSANFPKEILTMEEALKSIDIAYHMNHRNGKIGNYTYSRVDDETGKIECTNPFPDQFDLGLIKTVAETFKSPGKPFSVEIDQKKPIRGSGAESTTFIIKGIN